MNRKTIFEAVRAILEGRGQKTAFSQKEVDLLDSAIDEATGVIVVRPPNKKGRQINAAGERLIKSFEGLELEAYPDPGSKDGKPITIGWGATVDLDGKPFQLGRRITEDEAHALFDKDTDRFELAVDRLTFGRATDNQFAAMVSLAYNIGIANFSKSTLLVKHNLGDHAGAAAEFKRWSRAGGKVMRGLTRRRAAEAELYGRA